jgi:hypothetical protein
MYSDSKFLVQLSLGIQEGQAYVRKRHPTVVTLTNFELASILIEILKLKETVFSFFLDGNNFDILMGGSTLQQVVSFCLLYSSKFPPK